MPGPAIPLIIGAGARILGGIAAKQGAKSVAKKAVTKYPTSNVRTVPSRGPGAKKTTKSATKRRPKSATPKRPPTVNSPKARELAAQARKRKAERMKSLAQKKR